MSRATTAAFVGSIAVITWRELNNPPSGAPLPIPMPSRYVGAAIVFGILEFMSDIWNPRISNWLAAAFFLVLLINTAQTGITKGGSEEGGPVAGAEQQGSPAPYNGNPSTANPFSNPGSVTGPGFLPPPPQLGLE